MGPQPPPIRSFHNSGWVTSPARDLAERFSAGVASRDEAARLKGYVQEIMRHFNDDDRVLMWELYNEPGRGNALEEADASADFGDRSAKLMQKSWEWARAVEGSKPVTSTSAGSLGEKNIAINRANSDIHSIHCYGSPERLQELIDDYARDGRPMICSEYLARELGSTIQTGLPILKSRRVGAINWGFVSGQTGTIWPWSSRDDRDLVEERSVGNIVNPDEPFPEPDLWFHDLFRHDGTPFFENEVDVIRKLTGRPRESP